MEGSNIQAIRTEHKNKKNAITDEIILQASQQPAGDRGADMLTG